MSLKERFALLDMGLMAYANGRSSKPKPYTMIAISPKEKFTLITKEKIEKREIKIER